MRAIFKKKVINVLFLIPLIILMTLPIIALSSINVLATQPFNIEIELPNSYKTVNPGSEIWFTIKLLNLANSQRVDVTLNYNILDSSGKSLVHNSKTVAIETQASFVADLKLPEDIQSGDYNINVVVNSSLGESNANAALKVFTAKKDLTIYYVAFGIIIVLILIFIIVKSKPLIAKLQLKMKINRIVREKLKKN